MCYQNTVRVIQTLCKFWTDMLHAPLLTLGKHSNINGSPALCLDSGKMSMGVLWQLGSFTIYLWASLCWRYFLFHRLRFTVWPFVLWRPSLLLLLCFPKERELSPLQAGLLSFLPLPTHFLPSRKMSHKINILTRTSNPWEISQTQFHFCKNVHKSFPIGTLK